MFMTAALRKLTIKLAIFVILFSALAPGIAHSLGATGRADMVEVCTALGSKWISLGDGSSRGSLPVPTHFGSLEHCPYCAHHVHAIGPPPTDSNLVLAPSLGRVEARLFLSAPRSRFAWTDAQPRAPPHFS